MTAPTPLAYAEVGSIPIVIDANVPLVGPARDAWGRVLHPVAYVPVLFWIMFGKIHIHPDRLEEFRLHIQQHVRVAYVKGVSE